MKRTQKELVLETRNLTKRFGALIAISGVNLKIGNGIHSIIGPNGAGKTTLFNLLTGFLRPDKGKVFFRGIEITDLPPFAISHMGLARSFQITSIFPDLTVHENVRIAAQSRLRASYNFLTPYAGLKGVAEKTKKVLEQVGLSQWAGSIGKTLPYGLQRCLDLAIALATEPKLILLDEPTSGMSMEDIGRVLDLVQQISRDIPMILVEHNIDVVMSISDVVTVLYQGMVLSQGTPSEIRSDPQVQKAYLGGY